MKKSLLLSLTALAVLGLTTATTLYAQTAIGTSLIDKMKAAVGNFTLSASLNPGQTGLQSAPVSGKKTGDILTAGEWNRMLELVNEAGSDRGSGWVDVPLTDTADFDDSCMYRYQITYSAGGREPYVPKETYYFANGISKAQLVWWLDNDSQNTTFHIAASSKNLLRINGTPYTTGGVSVTKIEKLCGGGSVSSGGAPVFYYCTNAQSADVNNAPCYGAARNGGAGTDRYRVVSCSNTDASGTYTAGGLLNFGNFIANKWSFHINNSHIACTDGSVLVMDIQGGGGGSPNCPAGFTRIGDGGLGSFCISTASETPTTYAGAMEVCYQKNAEICGNAEWYSACRANETAKVALQGMGGSTMEMTFTGAYNYTVMAMGSGGGQTWAGYFINGSKCETKGYMLDARNNNAYRCCIK